MANSLTPSEYRDNLVNAQEFKGRFTFPSQKIQIGQAVNGSAGRSEYQLIIGNDADFHIQAITGVYKYLYASTQAIVLTKQAIQVLSNAYSGISNGSGITSETKQDFQAQINNMTARLNAYLNRQEPSDNFLIDLSNLLSAIQALYIQIGAASFNDYGSLTAFMGQLGATPFNIFGLPHGQANDGSDDLAMRMVDGRSNRTLTEGFVPLELMLSPGAYGNPLRLMLPFSHVIERNSNLRMEFVNHTDSPAVIELAFSGTKFYA